MNEKRCVRCAFAAFDCDDWQFENNLVECRVNPPVPRCIGSVSEPSAAFPTVREDWWCGRFQPRTPRADEKGPTHGDVNE